MRSPKYSKALNWVKNRLVSRDAATGKTASIRTHILLRSCALVVLSVVIAYLAFSFTLAVEVEKGANNHLLATTAALKDKLGSTITHQQHKLEIVARKFADSEGKKIDQAAAQAEVDHLAKLMPGQGWFAIVAGDGRIIASDNSALVGASVASQPWFGYLEAGRSFVEFGPPLADTDRPGPTQGRQTDLYLVAPLEAAGGGVVVGDWSEDYFDRLENDFFLAADDPDRITVSLFDGDGALWVGPSEERHLSKDELREIAQAPHGLFHQTIGEKKWMNAYSSLVRGEDYAGPDIIVVAHKDHSATFSVMHEVWKHALAIVIAICMIAVLVGARMAAKIAAPLIRLALEADMVGRDPEKYSLGRHDGATEIVTLTGALRSLILRLGQYSSRAQDAEKRSEEEISRVSHNLQSLRQLADTDPLTGLLNRRAFSREADAAFDKFRTENIQFAVVMLDLDHFKSINDRFGHKSGDAVLSRTGALMQQFLRGTDKLCRFGGEEFIAVLSGADIDAAMAVTGQIRQSIAEQIFAGNGEDFHVTLSAGVAVAESSDGAFEDVVERADIGLYDAKRGGRNRVCAGRPGGKSKLSPRSA